MKKLIKNIKSIFGQNKSEVSQFPQMKENADGYMTIEFGPDIKNAKGSPELAKRCVIR